MGTGSVDDQSGSNESRCRRCLSPFSDGDTKGPWKKGPVEKGDRCRDAGASQQVIKPIKDIGRG